MKTKKRLLPALVFSAFAALAAPAAQAQSESPFSNVYVFGDSLSDAGFYRPFLLGLGLPPAVVAQLGRFTTNPGPVWAELVSQYYGFTPSPSNANGGNIFAQGGARVVANSASTPPGFAQRPVSVQIDEFLARGNGSADPDALYAVWAGGNDFLQNSAAFQAGQITQQQFQGNVLAAATAEIGQIARLRAAGARYILVFALPDIGSTPASAAGGPAAQAGATALSAGYNTTLFTGLASQGIKVIPVDVFALLNEIRANPAAYGFTNLTGIACGPFPPITTSGNSQFCLPSNLVSAGAADSFLFADAVHPTAATHRIIANFVESLIDGPLQYSLLAENELRTRAAHIRTLADNVPTPRRGDGGVGVFVAADGGSFEIDPGFGGYTGLDSRMRAFTVGLTMQASDNVTLGAAIGSARSRVSFGKDMGGFHNDEKVASLFAAGRWGGLYGLGVVSLADTRYSHLERSFSIGQVRRTASSTAEGSNASAHLAIGYDLLLGRLRVGPTVSVTTQNVTVNGFDEAGAGTANLRVHEQKRRSEIWSAGVKLSMEVGAWTPWLRVTADKERRDDQRFVTATPLTMVPTGSSYDLPAYMPDNTFITGAIGVNGAITDRIGVSLAYMKVSGRSGISEDAVSGMLSIRF